MNARDELAREIFIADNSNQSREASIKDWQTYTPGEFNYTHAIADRLLAAGYRKPRTISEGTRVSLVDSLLAYKGTPRHKLFEYPHRDDDSRAMIREAEAVVTAILAVLYEPTQGGAE